MGSKACGGLTTPTNMSEWRWWPLNFDQMLAIVLVGADDGARMCAVSGTQHEAAAMLRRLLDAVERCELDADSPRARRLFLRLDGAAQALDITAAGPKQRPRTPPTN